MQSWRIGGCKSGSRAPALHTTSESAREFAPVVIEAGEDRHEIGNADVLGEDFAEDGTEIRGERQVAPFVQR